MSNHSTYKSVDEWRKAKPEDYRSAFSRGLLKDICEHYGWEYKEPKVYARLNLDIDLSEELGRLDELMVELETETEKVYHKGTKAAAIRVRKSLQEIKDIGATSRKKITEARKNS